MKESQIQLYYKEFLTEKKYDLIHKFFHKDCIIILHPKHVASGTYNIEQLPDLLTRLDKGFPGWKEKIENIYHDKSKNTYIVVAKANSINIKDMWDIHFIKYEDDKIINYEVRIDTLHLAESNIGAR